MTRLIINPRGTSGSGKTVLVRSVMESIGIRHRIVKGTKITGYVLKDNTYVLGSYKTECGGADTVKTLDEVKSRVIKATQKYETVLFEGVLVSDVFGRWLELSKSLYSCYTPSIYVWAILDTPLDVCIERVIERRKVRGKNDKPFDPKKHTIPRHDKVMRGMKNAINEGQLVVSLDHKKAVDQIIRIIKHREFPKDRTYNLNLYKVKK